MKPLLTILLFWCLNASAQTVINASLYMTNTTADQTSQLQAALNACNGTNLNDTAVLILPNYTFYTKQVNPKSYTKVVGQTNTVWRPYIAGGDQSERMFYVNNKEGVSLRNITFMMGMAPGDLMDGWCPVSFENNARYFELINFYIEHYARNLGLAQNNTTNTFGYAGVKIASSSNGIIRGGVIKNTDANIHITDDYGIDTENIDIADVICDGGTSEGITVTSHVQTTIGVFNIDINRVVVRNKLDSYGVLFAGVDGFTLANSIINNCSYGIGLSTTDNVGLTGGLYQHASINGNIYKNRLYYCNDGFKGNGSYINVYENHFGSMWGSAINTQRGFGTSSYQAQYLNFYNNTVDTLSLFYPYTQAAIKIFNMSNCKIVNNLFRTRGSDYGIAFYNTSGYGTGNTIKNNIIDNDIRFEVNNFTQANTLTGNHTTGYEGFTPGGSWTVSGQTIGVWSPPAGTLANEVLLFYNQTGGAFTFPFVGVYKATGGTEYAAGINLTNQSSAILFKSSIQPVVTDPGIIIKGRRIIVQ